MKNPIAAQIIMAFLGLQTSVAFAKVPLKTARPTALVYDGPGACGSYASDGINSCTGAAEAAARAAGFNVVHVGPSALSATSTEADYQKIFAQASAWIQPGGGSKTFLTTATPELKKAIHRFVEEGGGYVGLCAGAFSSTAIDGALTIEGLNVLPGRTYPFINETIDMIFDNITQNFNPDALNNHIYAVNWAGKTRHLYFEEGPMLRFDLANLATVEVMATLQNGEAVAARTNLGKGRVYVTGMHPEAPSGWRRNPDLTDPDGLDLDLVKNMLMYVTHQSTSEKPLVGRPYAPVMTHTVPGKYVGLKTRFDTVRRARGSQTETPVASTEIVILSYDAPLDTYNVRLTHTTAQGAVTTKDVTLWTQELDEQFSGSMLTDCLASYGVIQGNRCSLASGNSVIEVGQVAFGVFEARSTAADGSLYINRQ